MTTPHGSWPSPISPESLAAAQVRLDEVRVDGVDTYWLEGRPAEAGRLALVRHDGASGTRADVLPAPWNARTAVHEYGGGAYAVRDGVLVFSHFADGRVYRLDPGSDGPVPITPAADLRYGGLVLAADRVYAVREDHRGEGEAVNELVALELSGPNADGGQVLVSGPDFVSRPTLSPDATELAWVEWDHPNMPWDSTRLRRGRVGASGLSDVSTVAGGEDISVAQPQFCADGTLWFVSDETGWWNLYCDKKSGPVDAVAADIAAPQWSLGMVDYAVLDDGRILLRGNDGAEAALRLLNPTTGVSEALAVEASHLEHLQAAGTEIALKRGLADRLPEVVRMPLDGPPQVLATSSDNVVESAYVSRAEPWTWTNSTGLEVHGHLFRPANPEADPVAGELPALLVVVHGGPTSASQPSYQTGVHFWTTRGFTVLDVNYSGSTGYGRAYRERLRGQWGVIDIDDVVTGAASLADEGLVDRDRMVIRGGSAGGYAVLRALTTSAVFAGGTSYFGIGDLADMAQDTHKFESRYLDSLLGPLPQAQAVYDERSPVRHIDALNGALLLLQGAEDKVVPLAQAQDMADAMRAAGKEVELVVYEGESHGFRGAHAIVDSIERELAFYQRTFGLEPVSATS